MQGKTKGNTTRWQEKSHELPTGKRKQENQKSQEKQKTQKVLDQQPKSENVEKEIEEMAKNIRLANKETMNLLESLARTPNGKIVQKNHPPQEETEDWSSVKGQFGWAEIADTTIPYLIRSKEKYVSLRMVETKVFVKFKNVFSDEVRNCFKVKILHATPAEVKLLNEINFRHCDNLYGNLEFTNNEGIVSLHDFVETYNFLTFCYAKLIERANVPQTRCGFTKIADQNWVPYIRRYDKQYYPLFYFEGECQYLKEKSIEITGWDLAYLKLYCKIQGIRKSLYDCDALKMVDLDLVQKFFPPNAIFEESWPSDYKIDFLLQKPVPKLVLFQAQNPSTESAIKKQPSSQTEQRQVVIKESQAKNTALPRVTVRPAPLNASHVSSAALPSLPVGTQKKSRPTQVHPNNNFQVFSAPNVGTNHQVSMSRSNSVVVPNHNPIRPLQSIAPTPNDFQRSFVQYSNVANPNHVPVYRQPLPARPRVQKPSKLIQIPEVTFTDAYFLSTIQVEGKTLKYCINKEPYVHSVLLVSLEECSVFFLLPVDAVINAVNVINVDIYLPNKMQKKTFEKFKLYLSKGLVKLQDFVESLPQLKYILCKSQG